jgi:hypothetical protein
VERKMSRVNIQASPMKMMKDTIKLRGIIPGDVPYARKRAKKRISGKSDDFKTGIL